MLLYPNKKGSIGLYSQECLSQSPLEYEKSQNTANNRNKAGESKFRARYKHTQLGTISWKW